MKQEKIYSFKNIFKIKNNFLYIQFFFIKKFKYFIYVYVYKRI